jgi:hypothetical protein
MEKVMHWTQSSIADFIYNISATFVSQLESRMEEREINKSELAIRLQKTNGRVSQVLNDPGNLSLRVIVEYARALGLKVGIIAYDDGDPDNNNGPINPDVFVKSWEKLNRPVDLFEVEESSQVQYFTDWSALIAENVLSEPWPTVQVEVVDTVRKRVTGQSQFYSFEKENLFTQPLKLERAS